MTPTDICLDSSPRRRIDVSSVELDGEALLYAGASGEMLRLDPLATVLWNCLDGETPLRELVDDLTAVFATDPDQVSHDVLHFTRQLGELGLLDGVAGVT